MDSYGTNLAAWCEDFLNRLNLAVNICGPDEVPTRASWNIAVETAQDGAVRFTGAWTDEQVDGAVEQGDLLLVITVLGGTQDAGYRVKVQRRHCVDVLLSRYQDAGARTQGKGVVQASETFKSAQDAADWVRGHNNELLDLMATMPAEAEKFAELNSLAKNMGTEVEVIRNVSDFQIRVTMPNFEYTKQFLQFLELYFTNKSSSR